MNEHEAFEAMDLIEDRFLNEALMPRRQRFTFGKGFCVGIAAAFLLFFMTINVLPQAALSLSDIPLLGEIAKAITLDPSMRACLKNNYAQYVDQRDKADPYHSQICYLVIDASRISVFFRTDASTQRNEDNTNTLFNIESVTDGNGAKMLYGGSIYKTEVKGLYEYRMDLSGESVPSTILFTIRYFQGEWSNEIARTNYTIHPDNTYAQIVVRHMVNETATILGQTVTIDRLDIYPTQAKLFFSTPSTNDMLLKEMKIALRDEKGRTYPPRSNGTIGTSTDESEVLSLWYESPYFANVNHLDAVITAVSFLHKTAKYGLIDLKTNTIGHMPEGVRLTAMTLQADGSLEIALKVTIGEDGVNQTVVRGYLGPKGSGWFDRSGYSYQPVYWSSAANAMIGDTEEGYEYQIFSIPDYTDGVYSLEWDVAPTITLEEPLVIPLIGNQN